MHVKYCSGVRYAAAQVGTEVLALQQCVICSCTGRYRVAGTSAQLLCDVQMHCSVQKCWHFSSVCCTAVQFGREVLALHQIAMYSCTVRYRSAGTSEVCNVQLHISVQMCCQFNKASCTEVQLHTSVQKCWHLSTAPVRCAAAYFSTEVMALQHS
jgi:hypothetical protein